MKNMKKWVLNKWRSRSVGQQECVGDKMDMPARNRAGTRNRGNFHDCRGSCSPRGHFFCFAQPHSSDSVGKAIGHTVELYFIWFNRRLFGKYIGLVSESIWSSRGRRVPHQDKTKRERSWGSVRTRSYVPQYWIQWTQIQKRDRWAEAGNRPSRLTRQA